ncbi:hypothetical protein TL16_g03234 [Triparma laevis f. inornata]|uniref:Uncharacterized protein n=1 Tax=Triparma laevis f. inornata TaxID=1714386 RepID=A0A9W7E0E4_9STRA|nr:hypothetical protein TL16_g03234 [Triparma laevis f. inornata]
MSTPNTTPITPSIAEIKFTNAVATSQKTPVALAPLRWNLVRLTRQWDTKIQSLVAQSTRKKSEMIKNHRQLIVKHGKNKKKAFENEKAKMPLNKRLEMMQKSYVNLKNAKQEHRAESLKRRLDPMVKSFYRSELSEHITKARNSTSSLKNELQSQQASLNVEVQKAISKMKAEKDTDLKGVRRNNKRSSDDPFSLHFAAIHGEMTRLEVLMERKAIAMNIDKRDPDSGWTALHFAARSGHVEFANVLISHNADVNALGPNNETPLHLAAGWGTKEMVGLLLGIGGDKSMEWNGKTAEVISRDNMRTDIAKVLERWMPVGLGYATMRQMSEPPEKDFVEEPNIDLQRQLRALDMKINKNGRDYIGLVHSYAKLANLYRAEGRFEDAVESLKRVVELRQKDLANFVEEPGSPLPAPSVIIPNLEVSPKFTKEVAVAEAMNNLGELSHEQGDYESAQRYFTVSLETMERLHGKDTPATIPVLKNLACHYLDSNKLNDSYVLLLRYLKFQKKKYTAEGGGEGLALVDDLDLCAYCCVLNRDFVNSKIHAIHAKGIVERELGKEDIKMAERWEKLGFIYFAGMEGKECQGAYMEAKRIMLKSGREEFDEEVMKIERNIAVSLCAGSSHSM